MVGKDVKICEFFDEPTSIPLRMGNLPLNYSGSFHQI
jgi:hypothetical protein